MDTPEMKGTVDDLKEQAERSYRSVREGIQESTRKAQDEFETFSEKARPQLEAAWESTIALIQDNPVSSMGIAVLVGVGVGALLTAWAKD